jgi:hypothetical protein
VNHLVLLLQMRGSGTSRRLLCINLCLSLICFYVNEEKEIIRMRQPSDLCPLYRKDTNLAEIQRANAMHCPLSTPSSLISLLKSQLQLKVINKALSKLPLVFCLYP